MITLVFVSLTVITIYWWIRSKFNYWKRRGYEQLEPTFPVGNFGPFFRQQMSVNENFVLLYERSHHLPLVGIYLSLRPALLINDPELVRNVLVRDFEHFHDRGFFNNVQKDPLSNHIIALRGEEWKYQRSRLNAAFTTNRLQEMVPNMEQVGKELQKYIGKLAATGELLNVREIMSRYFIDVIASVAFGIDIDCINNGDHVFRRMSTKVLQPTWMNMLRLGGTVFTPKLKEWFGFSIVEQQVEDFILNLVNKISAEREQSHTIRKDVMQLLLQLRNSGAVSTDADHWDIDTSSKNKTLTFEQIAANALIFFVAGYESSASTFTFCLYELCKHPIILRKAQQEIDEVIVNRNEPITYNHLIRMKYLESCIDETLRKYPVLAFLNRECTKDYPIPNTNKIIPKGTPVVIPTLGLHRNPAIYPDPHRFNPERFNGCGTECKIATRPHLSFGAGPHSCIGYRLGKLQLLLGLTAVLSRFDLQLAEQSKGEVKLHERSLVILPKDPIYMIVTERKKA